MEILVIALVSGLIGALIGGFNDRGGAGFWLGFFLGPIGWIIVLLIGKPAGGMMSAPAANGDLDALLKLSELRKRDVITEAEFNVRRDAILGRGQSAPKNKIEAIKQYRAATGCDLHEAKRAVEARETVGKNSPLSYHFGR